MKTGAAQPPQPVICCLGDTALVGRTQREVERLGLPIASTRLWGPAGGADIIFFNLEAAICSATAPRTNKRYNLKTDPAILGVFDPRCAAGLANNHIMDFGEAGLAETIGNLDASRIPHAGAGPNLEAARRPAIIEAKGVRLAFLSAADPRFSPATDRSPGTFPARPELLAEGIAAARRETDHVIIAIHAGIEFASVPFPNTIHLAEICLEAGARVVVFHHAHCPSGWRRDERGLVLFGTGKYAFPYEDFTRGALERRLLLPSRRSAAWLVHLPMDATAPTLSVHPLTIGTTGLPEEAAPPEAQAVAHHVERISRKLNRPAALAAGRWLTFLNPVFLWLNLSAYLDIARRQGLRHMWTCFINGLTAQLGGRQAFRLKLQAEALAAHSGADSAAPSKTVMTHPSRWVSFLRQGLFWLLPILILFFIFQRIDLQAFRENMARARPGMVLLGLLYYPLVILIGALRWRLLLAQFNRCRVGLGFALKHYWIGLAVGLFGPASVGWDAYRLIVTGRRFGHYAPNAAAIVTEKLLALATCAGLVIGLYPFLPIEAGGTARTVLGTACGLFGVAAFVFLFLVLARQRLDRFISALAAKLLQRVPEPRSEAATTSLLGPLTSWRLLRGTLALSFANLFIAALGNQIFFRAVGHPLPFLANLFVLPILMFVFLLPISFGSLGIREGAYILLYGLFGVPPETALLVSFFNLAGLLLNNLIGGVLIAVHGAKDRHVPIVE
jgi:poly-gamma-glutamate capsule biosynthesis protein CapA/YwtB (metallophosphatase superfamily)/uncharacterized membrane protein YbhN (UPF0104 family)